MKSIFFTLLIFAFSYNCGAQIISISNGFYNQKSFIIDPMQNQVDGDEMDSFGHIDVDNIYKFKGLEVGASYSFMQTGISIFAESSNSNYAGLGTQNLLVHRIGFKLSFPFDFWKRFAVRPYVLSSYEVARTRNNHTTTISYAEFDTSFSNISISSQYFDVDQFVPSFGGQLNVRVFRSFNLIFNWQYSFGFKVATELNANYVYQGSAQNAKIQNTNSGSMMGFGLAYDLDYKHIKKSKDD